MTEPTTSHDRSTPQLLSDFSQQTATLVRQELELARAEMTRKGKQAGIGVGLFGGAGALGFYGLGALVAAGILLLATAMKGWLAALIVAGGLFVVAGIVALIGKASVSRGVPPVPEQAIETTKDDIAAVRERASGKEVHA